MNEIKTMHGINSQDGDRQIDWSETSEDYAKHRPGYPASFYERLKESGVGAAGQRILDIGCGTGALTLELARRGAKVTGVDISDGQIKEARRRAEEESLPIDFRVSSAEDSGLTAGSFDLITASQCWLYFDPQKMIPEVHRLLAPGGRLLTCHMCWLPRLDTVARKTEELILKHNPDWSAADWDGAVPIIPDWSRELFCLDSMFYYDQHISFTRESWRGRIRASRGVGASLSPTEVANFDSEHQKLIEKLLPKTQQEIAVLHRLDAHLFSPLPRK